MSNFEADYETNDVRLEKKGDGCCGSENNQD